MGANPEAKPFHLHLVDNGYDVWIGNNRGTEYSRGHKTLDAATDKDYWDYSWSEYGLYDDTANVEMIKKEAGVDKIFYVGYSMGTVQMFYGLAHKEESFFADSLHKVIALAPCFATDPAFPPICEDEECLTDLMQSYDEKGIYAAFGPGFSAEEAC